MKHLTNPLRLKKASGAHEIDGYTKSNGCCQFIKCMIDKGKILRDKTAFFLSNILHILSLVACGF